MPTPDPPPNFGFINIDDQSLRSAPKTIEVLIYETKKINPTTCDFGTPETYDVNFSQVELTQDQIDDGWEFFGLLQIAYHCRRKYNSDINPDLKFRF